jgi:hypothetical protein
MKRLLLLSNPATLLATTTMAGRAADLPGQPVYPPPPAAVV